MRWRSLSTHSSPWDPWQQLIQLNYTYFILAFVKLNDKYYFFVKIKFSAKINEIINTVFFRTKDLEDI